MRAAVLVAAVVIPDPLLFQPSPDQIDGCRSLSVKDLGIRCVHRNCLGPSGCLFGIDEPVLPHLMGIVITLAILFASVIWLTSGTRLFLRRLEVSLPLLNGWAEPEIDLDLELIRFRFFRLYAQDHHPLDKIIN